MYNNGEKKNCIYQKKRLDSKRNSLYKRIHKEYSSTEGKKISKKQFICENAKKNLNLNNEFFQTTNIKSNINRNKLNITPTCSLTKNILTTNKREKSNNNFNIKKIKNISDDENYDTYSYNNRNIYAKSTSNFPIILNKVKNKNEETNDDYSNYEENLKDYIIDLEKRINELKESNELKSQQIDDLTLYYNNILEREKEKSEINDKILKDLENKENKLYKINEENITLKNEKEKIQKDLQNLREKFIKKVGEINKTENKIKEIKNQEKENLKFKEIIRKLDTDINKIKRENETLKEYKEKIEKELEKYKNELNEKEKEIDKLNKQNETNNLEYQKLKKEIERNNKLKEENEKIKKENKEFEQKNILYEKENEKLKEDILKIKKESEKIKEDILKIKKENDKNKQEKELIKQENEKIKEETKLLKKENEKLKEEKGQVKKENEIINQENRNIKKENGKFKQENKIIKEELENNAKNIEKVQKENKKLIKNKEILETEIKDKKEKYNLILDFINKIFENIEPLKLIYKPTLIGLNNIGAETYINPVLQCFSQTKFLTNYFLKKSIKDKKMDNDKNNNSIQLYQLYIELIDNLWIKNGVKSFSPDNFKYNIEKMNPIFRINQNGSSKDFIIFLLTQLHKELVKPNKSNNNQSNLKSKQQPLNQYNKNIIFENFINGFSQEVSIISDFFFGFTETTIECLNCKNNYNLKGLNSPLIYNYGIFNCIIIKLEEINDRKKNYNLQNNNFIQNNHISIYDYFFFKKKLFQNQNYCQNCNNFCDSIFSSKIFLSPNIIIIILEREKYKKTSIKLDFTETIDITQFVLKKVSKLEYNLYAVITSINKGNYKSLIASIKSPIDNKWHRYEDEKVYPINNIQLEVIEFGTPEILFYEKKGLTL